MGRVRRLDDAVIARIAAGEVVLSPDGALKELLENSIDSAADQISVHVAGGGLKTIRVQDNGCGICVDDFPLISERFATSKLTEAEDLLNIATLGFRGEALASLCRVARVTVRSKTADSPLCYECQFLGGKMDGKPKPMAGNQGTVITLHSLFYNLPQRLAALGQSAADCWRSIYQCVQRFAVNYPHIGFTLKRDDKETSYLKTAPNSTSIRNVATCFGSDAAQNVVPFECGDVRLSYKANGVVSTACYAGKTSNIFFFVNNRLVECTPLKRSIQQLYANYIQKHRQPFVYLNLSISPHHVDVNLHPSKREVRILYEMEIVDSIVHALDDLLKECDESRTVLVAKPPSTLQKTRTEGSSTPTTSDASSVVRVDYRNKRLDDFEEFRGVKAKRWLSEESRIEFPNTEIPLIRGTDVPVTKPDEVAKNSSYSSTDGTASVGSLPNVAGSEKEPSPMKGGRRIRLTSVMQLQQEICSQSSPALRAIFREFSFVGCVNPKFALVQYKTGLYMLNVEQISQELFYQIMIMRFGDHEALRFSQPCCVRSILEMAVHLGPVGAASNLDVDKALQLLATWAPMLWNYFSLEIVDHQLISIPKLLENYVPQMEGLADYLLALVQAIDWMDEKNCFRTFCQQTSRFYAFKQIYCDYKANDNDCGKRSTSEDNWQWTVKRLLCEAFRSNLLPGDQLTESGAVVKLTDVRDVYKSFDRR